MLSKIPSLKIFAFIIAALVFLQLAYMIFLSHPSGTLTGDVACFS